MGLMPCACNSSAPASQIACAAGLKGCGVHGPALHRGRGVELVQKVRPTCAWFSYEGARCLQCTSATTPSHSLSCATATAAPASMLHAWHLRLTPFHRCRNSSCAEAFEVYQSYHDGIQEKLQDYHHAHLPAMQVRPGRRSPPPRPHCRCPCRRRATSGKAPVAAPAEATSLRTQSSPRYSHVRSGRRLTPLPCTAGRRPTQRHPQAGHHEHTEQHIYQTLPENDEDRAQLLIELQKINLTIDQFVPQESQRCADPSERMSPSPPACPCPVTP